MATLPLYSAADLSAFFKTRYPQRKLENLVAYGKPFLEAVSRSDELTGVQTIIPIHLDGPRGLGNTLQHAAAQGDDGAGAAGGGSVYGKSWTITRSKYYAVLYLDAETMMASRNDEGAFFKQRERNLEGIMEGLGQHLEMACWSTANGSLGTVLTDPSTNAVVALNAGQAMNFHRGDKFLVYADAAGIPDTGTVRAGGPYTVSSIDEDADTVTITATFNAAVAVGDHLVRATADAANTREAGNLIKSICDWIPSSAPTAGDSFFGLDRSAHGSIQKLAGWRQSWLGSIEEGVKRLDAKMRRVRPGGSRVLWLSFQNFNRLEQELGARGYRVEDGGEGKFGRVALKMSTPGGGVTVKAGPYVPESAGFLLDMSTWKLMSLGKAPHLVEDDGMSALRIVVGTGNDGDGIEMRWRYFAQLVCLSPYDNGRIAIS